MEADPSRFREPDEVPWLDPVLVVCPRCAARASVTATGFRSARLLCPVCTLTRDWSDDRLHVLVEGRPVVLQRDHYGWLNPSTGEYQKDYEKAEGQDSRFGTPLWLQRQCCGGHLLWANNEAHLDYLTSYVRATLRERPAGPSKLSWYLPAWMKHAKHREEVLRTLGRLRHSLNDG